MRVFSKKKILVYLSLVLTSFSGVNARGAIQIGMNYHLIKENSNNINIAINETSKLGVTLFRLDFPWDIIERTPHNYIIPKKWDDIINILISKNIHPIIILGYSNHNYNNGGKPTTPDSIKAYADYAYFITNHFKGKVKYYEIWNEWDSHLGGKPESISNYKKIIKPTYEAIKRADKNAQVITGSFSSNSFNKILSEGQEDYLRDYITADMAKYTDIISIHPYTTYRKEKNRNYQSYLTQVNYAVNLIKSDKLFSTKPIFITEVGWSTAKSKDGVTNEIQKKYIEDSICDANKIGISAIIFYDLKDENNPKKDNTAAQFGFFDSNWSQKTPLHSLSSINCD